MATKIDYRTRYFSNPTGDNPEDHAIAVEAEINGQTCGREFYFSEASGEIVEEQDWQDGNGLEARGGDTSKARKAAMQAINLRLA